MRETINDVYTRLEQNKKMLREIKKSIKDELLQDTRYQEIHEEMKALREEKKMIEHDTTSQHEDAQIQDLKMDIATDKELLADITLNKIISDGRVDIIDEHDQRYVPQFSVKFIKD